MWEAKSHKELVPRFNTYYYCLTGIKADYTGNHYLWIDRLVDNYSKYQRAGFYNDESEVNAVLDTLEEISRLEIDNYYEKEGD